MSAYTPSDSTDGTAFIVSRTPNVSVINSYIVNGITYKMIATSVTTVVEFRGLSRSDALGMSGNADYNYTSKHGVRFTSSGNWMAMPECEGAECKAEARRINDADMFRVVVIYIETTVAHNGGWTKETF